MDRIYLSLCLRHLRKFRQMLFLIGPRQAGKTTTAKMLRGELGSVHYLNWDQPEDRLEILGSQRELARLRGLDELREEPTLLILDEIHKYSEWKNWLKGFFDSYEDKCRILVTGSARLGFLKKKGDSLMGRYFRYRIHPMSVGELLHHDYRAHPIVPPSKLAADKWENLIRFGGFPEPFQASSQQFYNNWRGLRTEQMLHEDIIEISRVQDVDRIELLAELLRRQVGQLTSYASLARKLKVTAVTIENWMRLLQAAYYCYAVRPWSKNVTRSLIKEPKYYLWDWAYCADDGARAENLIASHLLKAVHYWTDIGLGDYDLYYLRDKEKREVDFVVVRDGNPWFLVEVKRSENKGVSPQLRYFQKMLGASHAFQVALDKPYVDRDCFQEHEPIVVPATTFLSQLI